MTLKTLSNAIQQVQAKFTELEGVENAIMLVVVHIPGAGFVTGETHFAPVETASAEHAIVLLTAYLARMTVGTGELFDEIHEANS
jgi:hypothetical protein